MQHIKCVRSLELTLLFWTWRINSTSAEPLGKLLRKKKIYVEDRLYILRSKHCKTCSAQSSIVTRFLLEGCMFHRCKYLEGGLTLGMHTASHSHALSLLQLPLTANKVIEGMIDPRRRGSMKRQRSKKYAICFE